MTIPAPGELKRVLLVEDDEADVALLIEALGDTGAPFAVDVVGDGEEALRFLRRSDEHAEAARPSLVLLDLNLPLLDGPEVLAELKADPDLQPLPVIVMSTSQAREDIEDSYRRGATAYVPKPVEYEDFVGVVRRIVAFFAYVHLPG